LQNSRLEKQPASKAAKNLAKKPAHLPRHGVIRRENKLAFRVTSGVFQKTCLVAYFSLDFEPQIGGEIVEER
jgi:hypothetical protein